MKKHQLIGSEVSLYTGKLRSYLDYKAIPYDEVLATKEVFQEIIVPRTGVMYIPILITDDDIALQDTTEIIDFLEHRYPENSVYPEAPLQNLISLLLEIYGDEWLVIPAMHYRWSFQENIEFAWGEFGRTSSPGLSKEQCSELGKELSKPFAGALPRLGITDDTIAGVETSYLALLEELNQHFQEHDFLLGSRPCMGDFGLIGPLYAHLYRDPYSGRFMEEKAPALVAWIQRMISPPRELGHYVNDSAIADTLVPVLQRMVGEQGPVIIETIKQVADWADNNEGRDIPRAIGECGFEIGGSKGKRLTFPFMQWMWQRAYDHYQTLTEHDKQGLRSALEAVPGLVELLETPIKQRVVRKNNKLELLR